MNNRHRDGRLTAGAWLLVSLIAAVCLCYYLIADRVPLVTFFVPVGEVSRSSNTLLFWVMIVAHGLLAIVGFIIGSRILLRKRPSPNE